MDITPKSQFENRRSFLKTLVAAGALTTWTGREAFANSQSQVITDKNYMTGYNNYYEFTMSKDDVASFSQSLDISNWKVEVGGLVARPRTFTMKELLQVASIDERIYRFRCVEGWAMVVPWNGYSLSKLLTKVGIKPEAKYVAFESVDPRKHNLPGRRNSIFSNSPYVDGLRLDEAMHPLTLLTTGAYGEPLAKQSGAPVRIVVPWKYGFKGPKAITKITLVDKEPPSTWNLAAPSEYGFYSNVNPNVSHPRWSQASERLIGKPTFIPNRQKTQIFNGYDEVAYLYKDMDLKRYF